MLQVQESANILETYSWIKVPAFYPSSYNNWKEAINSLQEHHAEECVFLVNFMRERLGKSVPLHILKSLPDVDDYNEASYYDLDAEHLLITTALIEEIRSSTKRLLCSSRVATVT